MKNKKILLRIGTVLACVLIVSSLSLTCFAADYTDYGSVYQSFVNNQLTERMNVASFQTFMQYLGQIDNGGELGAQYHFFQQYVFASGDVLLDGRLSPFDDVGNDSFIAYESINYSLVVNGVAYNGYGELGVATITPILSIKLGNNVEFAGIFISSTNTIRISFVVLNGVEIQRSDIESISLSIGSNRVATGSSSGFVNLVSSMLFANPNYDYVTYPASYLQGYTDLSSGDQYQSGYNDAVNNMSSGEFGRNFLSGIFTAPLNALRSFTLVEWTTSYGTVITINLLTVLSAIVGLSLFIWFLKMFAGG